MKFFFGNILLKRIIEIVRNGDFEEPQEEMITGCVLWQQGTFQRPVKSLYKAARLKMKSKGS